MLLNQNLQLWANQCKPECDLLCENKVSIPYHSVKWVGVVGVTKHDFFSFRVYKPQRQR